MANIDRNDAPTVNNVPASRNWEHPQGDRRAVWGIRFRAPGATDAAPAYEPIHASLWRGHILERRSAAGVDPLSVDLTFNNVAFSYNFTDPLTSTQSVITSNREVQFHIPWEDTTLQTMLNPVPNRGTSFLYDIWEVTYPNFTDSFIPNALRPIPIPGSTTMQSFAAGDLVHFERLSTGLQTPSEIFRIGDTSVRLDVPDSSGYTAGMFVAMDYAFRSDTGDSPAQYLLGQVFFTDTTSSPNSVSVNVISTTNGGEEFVGPLPDPFGGTLEPTSIHQLQLSTTTNLSRARFRGTGLIRERIYANPTAGNENTNTGG